MNRAKDENKKLGEPCIKKGLEPDNDKQIRTIKARTKIPKFDPTKLSAGASMLFSVGLP